MARQPEDFEQLPLPRKDVEIDFSRRYRVYKSDNEFIIVEAGTALEALKASGFPRALRIEREALDKNNVLAIDAWGDQQATPIAPPAQVEAAPATTETQTPPPAEAAQAAAPAEASPPAATSETPLSNDDVNKLLGEDKG